MLEQKAEDLEATKGASGSYVEIDMLGQNQYSEKPSRNTDANGVAYTDRTADVWLNQMKIKPYRAERGAA